MKITSIKALDRMPEILKGTFGYSSCGVLDPKDQVPSNVPALKFKIATLYLNKYKYL